MQGILAALIRRAKTQKGAFVQVSLLESILDFQFEVITTHLADGGRPPQRSKRFNAHAYLAAPYGVYPTEDGYLALAMGDLTNIARLIGCHAHRSVPRSIDSGLPAVMKSSRSLPDHLVARPTAQWLAVLQARRRVVLGCV